MCVGTYKCDTYIIVLKIVYVRMYVFTHMCRLNLWILYLHMFYVCVHLVIIIICMCAHTYVGRTQLVDKEPHKDIPFGWYDVGDGLYNPDSRVVYTYTNKFLRNAGTYIH